MIGVKELYENYPDQNRYFDKLSSVIMDAVKRGEHSVEVYVKNDGHKLHHNEMYFPGFSDYLILMRSLGFEYREGEICESEGEIYSYIIKF